MEQKRKVFGFANQWHRELFILIVLSALVPALLTAVILFYLVFYLTAEQFGVPEAVYFNLFPSARRVVSTLGVALPAVLLFICWVAYDISLKITGPFDRVLKEMDEIRAGRARGPIHVRPKDRLRPLIERINAIWEEAASSQM